AIVTLAVVAAFGDVRTGRVPNTLTFGAAAIGLLFSAAHGGSSGLGASLLGYVVGLGVFLPLFALGGMGCGDVTLLGAFGAWLGPTGALGAAVWASLVGGAFAIVVAALHGYLSEALRNIGALVAVWRTVGPARVPDMTLSEGRGPRLAYAVPIGIGAIL